ncbi:MAG: hypothetical protein JWM95_1517 [Gemmatimonadetes bacterium]|nr:hypothetical protein [Gemmatimonadota bacterium]
MTHAADVTDEQELRTVREHGGYEVRALAYLTAVRRCARSLTRNSSDADDLTQETFVRALRSWHRLAPELNCRRWLFAICATVLSIPIGTVRSRLFRARYLLRAAPRDQRVQSA